MLSTSRSMAGEVARDELRSVHETGVLGGELNAAAFAIRAWRWYGVHCSHVESCLRAYLGDASTTIASVRNLEVLNFRGNAPKVAVCLLRLTVCINLKQLAWCQFSHAYIPDIFSEQRSHHHYLADECLHSRLPFLFVNLPYTRCPQRALHF